MQHERGNRNHGSRRYEGGETGDSGDPVGQPGPHGPARSSRKPQASWLP